MTKIRNDNYICIQGWMVNSYDNGGLGLKGNDLITYAIIYGFSQVRGVCFTGSISYIADWANSTRAGITKNIENLVNMGLIVKEESTPTNKYYVNVDALPFNRPAKEATNKEKEGVNLVDNVNLVSEGVNLVDRGVNLVDRGVNLVDTTCKQSLHNNIDNNINNNINNSAKKNDNFKNNVLLDSITKKIIQYLNNKCNTNFKSTTNDSRRLIKARLAEGFVLDDFFKVINYKYKEWGKKPFTFKNGVLSSTYLRPATLFGDKFESYLNEATCITKITNSLSCSESVEIDSDRSGVKF